MGAWAVRLGAAAALAFAAAAPGAWAHHSLAHYDQGRQTALSGVVVDFQFTQPHPVLSMETGSGAARQSWRLEMDNLYELKQAGLTRDTFRRGDRVAVSGNPMRDGSRSLYLRRLERPSDGLRYEQAGYSPKLTPGR